MIDSTGGPKCMRCGGSLGRDGWEGLCPRCLAAVYLGPKSVPAPGGEGAAQPAPSDRDAGAAKGERQSSAESKARWMKFAIFESLGVGTAALLAVWCWTCGTKTGSDFDSRIAEEAWFFLAVGLLCYVYAVPMALRMVSIGMLYGFRGSEWFKSEERWREMNAYAGRRMIMWSWLAIVFAATTFFVTSRGSLVHLPFWFVAIFFGGRYLIRRGVDENYTPTPNSATQPTRRPSLAACERGVALILIAAFAYCFVGQPYRVPTDEFSPALKRGEVCVLWKLGRVMTGDIIVYPGSMTDGTFLGRVLATSRKNVLVTGNGNEREKALVAYDHSPNPAQTVQRWRIIGRLRPASVRRAASFRDGPAANANSLGQEFVPVGKVKFCIWLTRVRDFEIFAADTDLKSDAWRTSLLQEPDHPVVHVTWEQAAAFCHWLTDKEHEEAVLPANQYYRLPTDLEWSEAAGLPVEAGATPAERDRLVAGAHPWGEDWPPPPGSGNYEGEEMRAPRVVGGYGDVLFETAPVGRSIPGAHGLYDMEGDIWEWCMDSWNAESQSKVLRGAIWSSKTLTLFYSRRLYENPGTRGDRYGFRMVRAVR